MGWLEFTAELAAVLAWPLALVICVLLLRSRRK